MSFYKYPRKLAKGAIIVFLGMFFGRALTYLYVALVARLGSTEYGLLSLGFAFVSFLSIFSILGLRTGVIRYVSFYKGKNNQKKIKGTIYSSLKISLPVSLVLMILLFVFAEKISLLVFHNPDLTIVLRIFSLAIPFLSLSSIFIGGIIGFQKIKYQVLSKEIIENIVKLILTFVLIYIGFGLFGAIIGYVIAIMGTAIFSFYFLQKKVFPFFKTKLKPVLITKELFYYSFPLTFVGVLALIIKWTDVLMIGYYRTTSDVGIYNVALPTANLLVLVPTALMVLFMPIITELYSKRKLKDILLLSKVISKWIFFVNLPIFLLIFLFSKQILNLMFGFEYTQASGVLLILIFGYMIFSLSHIYGAILNTIKKTKIVFYISLIVTIVNVILNYTLIPKIGMFGGAIATSSSLILMVLLSLIVVYKLTKIQILKLNYFKAIIAGLISVLIVYCISLLFHSHSIFLLIIFGLLFLGIYFVFLVLFKSLDEIDKEMLSYFFVSFNKKIKMKK